MEEVIERIKNQLAIRKDILAIRKDINSYLVVIEIPDCENLLSAYDSKCLECEELKKRVAELLERIKRLEKRIKRLENR